MVADIAESPIAQSPYAEMAKLSSEVAERLEELDALKIGSAAILVHRLSRLHIISPPAFDITLQMMHAPAIGLASFTEIAERACRSKQAAHHELAKALDQIRDAFPELAHVIRSTREQITRHEESGDAQRHNLDRAGRVRTANRTSVVGE